MHTPPAIAYSGLTFILDAPSRFDAKFQRLLSGPARDWLDSILPANFCIDSCDLRTIDTPASLLPRTTHIILAGAEAARHYGILSDPPGYIGVVKGIPALPVFYPQDCCDYKNMRADDDDEDFATSDRETKDTIPTLFRNKRFWTAWHIKKFLSPPPAPLPKLDAIVYPALDSQVKLLNSLSATEIFLDIETSRLHQAISCIGWSAKEFWPKIFVVPVYLHNGTRAYKEFYRFFRAFSLALARNTVVGHNLSFDLLILHAFYKFALPPAVFDTMVAHHRCFPEAEKSLGHAISAWTALPFHKNEITDPYNLEQERALWNYNAKDVYALHPIKEAILAHARGIPGLADSIIQGNNSFLPYLTTSLTGLNIDLLKLATMQNHLRKLQTLYAKISAILTGIAGFNPGSAKQCTKFFHDTLHYPVISRTPKGAPAIGTKQLYQLLLKHNNPVLPVVIKYREVAKDASMLESNLWRLP